MPYLGQSPSKGDENNFKILDDISSYTLTFDGSDSSVVSAANDTVTSLTHRFVQGQRVTYNNGGGSNIAGLTSGTVYYIIKHDHHNIKLATSSSNAANGTAVNITNVGGGASHTINVAFDGVNTKFKATHTNGQKAKITRSAQLVISINGVIQQPHDSATPSTGFGFDLDGTIVFSQAPVSTDVFWAHVLTNNNVTFDISNNDIDNFTGDGSTTEFNLSKSPPDNRNILVTIDGVVQYPNDPDGTARAYVVVENVLTFNSAPPSGVEIQVRHIGFAGSTSGSGGVTNFYGRTGSVVLKDTDNITVNDAAVTGNLTVDGNFTANGDFTTLNTTLREVELLHVDANSSTTAGIITQRGSGDILNLFDNNSEVLTVTDGGQIGINSTSPSNGAILDIGVPTTKTGGLDSTVSIASTDNKTYPTAASFNVTLGLKQEIEVGGTQPLSPSSPGGYNFITGITNFMRKKNGNVQDVERSYYAGINQNFSWTDENTLKQYVGITDSIAYFGKDANGRTTNYIIAKQMYINPGDGNTATINQAHGQELRFQNFSAGTTPTANVTNWSGFRPAINWYLLGGNYNGTTTDAMFYDTSPTWGVTAVSGGAANYTISNLYGLRLRPPGSSTGLTITNNYGISQEWSSAKNYFAGKVGVGVNDPEAYQSSSNNLVVGDTGNAAGITIRSGTSNGGYITFANAGSGSGLYKSRISYDHSADKLSFSTNGTNRLFITGNAATNGRVGINTLSPNAPLDVFHNGSATYKDMIMARSHSGGFAVQCSDIDASNPTWTLRTYTLEDMIISPGGSGVNNHKVFIRASDGHIGINTTIPNKLVTIKAISPVVRIEAAESSDKRLDLMVSNVGIATISAEQSNQQLSLKTTSGEVRINKDGEVGIGTDNPGQKLDVRGDIIAYENSSGSVRLVQDGNIEITNNNGGIIDFKTSDTEDFDCRIRQMSNGLQFMTGGNGSTDERLRITNEGKLLVGIHTTSEAYTWSPRARFAVEGSGDASSVHFGQRVGGGADPAIMMLRRGGSTAWHHHVGRIYTNYEPSIYFQTSFAAAPGAENFKTGMVIKHNTGVGIGSDIPAKTLDILNTANADIRLRTTGNSFNSFTMDSNRAADTQFAVIDGDWNGTTVNRIQFVTGSDGTNKDDGYMAFHTRESGQSLAERLRLTSTGQVRIDGPTGATHGLRFTPNGWNGYDNRMGYCGTNGADFWWSSNWDPTTTNRDHSGYATNYIRQNINSGYLSFGTGGINESADERLRITSGGTVIAGATAISGGNRSQYSILAAVSNNTSASGHGVFTIQAGSNSSSGNEVAQLCFSDPQGDYAWIQAFADDATGATDKPGRLVFSTTPDGAAIPTEKLRITSAGRVGINSTSPEFEMDVLAPSGVTNTTLCVKGTGSGWSQVRLEGEGGATENYLTSTTVPLALYVGSGGQKAKFDTSGNFLIGAGGADHYLHIKQAATTTYTKIETTHASSNYTGLNLRSPTLNFQIWNQGPGATGYSGSNSVVFWQAAATGPYAFYHGNDERLRIASGGQVLIGTTASLSFNGVGQNHNLVVAGSSNDQDITDNYNAAITISNKDNTANNTAGLHFAREDNDGTPHYDGASIVAQFLETMNTGHYPKADLAFLTSTANNNAPSEKMRLKADGNVRASIGSFDSRWGYTVDVSIDTSSWANNTFYRVVNDNVFDSSNDTYLVWFKWGHGGSGAPWLITGNFLWTPTGANTTGAVSGTFTPVQAAHNSDSTISFRGEASGNVRPGLSAKADSWNPSGGTLEIKASKIGHPYA